MPNSKAGFLPVKLYMSQFSKMRYQVMDTIYCMPPCLQTLSPYPYGLGSVIPVAHHGGGQGTCPGSQARVVEVELNPGAVSTAPWPPEKSWQRLNVWSRMPSQQNAILDQGPDS